ncbi:MAG: 3-oxoadipate enol-lactonase [Actinomycetota bacterium]
MSVRGLAYRLEGQEGDTPLVLVNSLGTDVHMWDPQMPVLASARRVVRYDARGHGRSAPGSGAHSIEGLGTDVLSVLDHLRLDRVHLCGESLGGMVALWLAASRPERVDRLVLASTALRIGTPELWQARADTVRSEGMAAVADVVMERFFSPGFRERASEEVRRAKGTLLATWPEDYAASCLALRDGDLTSMADRVRAPALLLAGREDPATPVAEAERLQRHLPGSRLVVLDGGHLLNLEQPERFTDEVERFLNEIGEGAKG